MKPDQTTFGHPGGNCFSACVASLLELPIDVVPYFMEPKDWFSGFLDWLRPRGWWAFATTLVAGGKAWYPDCYYIMGGKSPRGDHAVVARGGEIVHDPHPSRVGLVAREDAIILIPLDPGARARS